MRCQIMKKNLLFTNLIINLLGMAQAAYALDFIFATAFLGGFVGVIKLMLDSDDGNKPEPPKANKSPDKPKQPKENKSSKEADIPKPNKSPESDS